MTGFLFTFSVKMTENKITSLNSLHYFFLNHYYYLFHHRCFPFILQCCVTSEILAPSLQNADNLLEFFFLNMDIIARTSIEPALQLALTAFRRSSGSHSVAKKHGVQAPTGRTWGKRAQLSSVLFWSGKSCILPPFPTVFPDYYYPINPINLLISCLS